MKVVISYNPSTSVNSWRPRKNNQVNKIAFIRSNGGQNHIYTMNQMEPTY
jgi:acetylglutamate synthase